MSRIKSRSWMKGGGQGLIMEEFFYPILCLLHLRDRICSRQRKISTLWRTLSKQIQMFLIHVGNRCGSGWRTARTFSFECWKLRFEPRPIRLWRVSGLPKYMSCFYSVEIALYLEPSSRQFMWCKNLHFLEIKHWRK